MPNIRNNNYECHVIDTTNGNYVGCYNTINAAVRGLIPDDMLRSRDGKIYAQNAETCTKKLKRHGYHVKFVNLNDKPSHTPQPRQTKHVHLTIEQPLQIEHKPLQIEYKPDGKTMNTPKLDYIVNTPCATRGIFAEHIVCADGATISVQCSSGHYCTPRDDNGPWTHVECWTDATTPECCDKYCSEEFDNGYVYSRIPVDYVREIIALHGGEKR